MATSASQPEAALPTGWGLIGAGTATALSTNNTVRRFGNHWLKSRTSRQQCEREIAVLRHLGNTSGLRVPNLKRNSNGELLCLFENRYWYVEEHIDGQHPSMASVGMYGTIAQSVGVLHDALLGLGLPVPERSVLGHLEALLQGRPAYPDGAHLLTQAQHLISSRLDHLRQWPQQPVHGDLTHPNILIDNAGICGFIDFEFLTSGPRAFDYATLIVTALARSELLQHEKASVLRNMASVAQLPQEDLLLACLAHRWMAALANLRHPQPSPAALQSQLKHLAIFYSMLSGSC